MKKSARITVIFSLILTASWIINPASGLEKNTFKDQVKIEHAEIILSSDNSQMAEAYSVIWNGTKKALNIRSFKGQDTTVLLVNTKDKGDGQLETIPSSLPRYIPPRSEFVMKKNGHYLLVPSDNLTENSKGYLFTVELDSGRQITAIADVMTAGTEPLDHHHATNDE